MDTQHIDTPIDPDIAGKERAGEPAMATQIEKSAERQQAGLRRRKPPQPVMQQNRFLARQTALLDIEPNMMPAIGQDDMLASNRVGRNREPGGDPVDADTVRVGRVRRLGVNGNCPGIEIGMPDDPRLRGLEVGMLGESAAPRAWHRRCRASPCWHVHTS